MNETLTKVKSIFTKRVLIVLVAVLALFIIFYPHTEKTKVNAELTGVFAVQKERYLLHQRVMYSTDFICVPGQVTKSSTIHYNLMGTITKTSTENCNGTQDVIQFNSNGTKKSQATLSFAAGMISTSSSEYTKDGQLLTQKVEFNGVTTVTEREYTTNILTKSTITTSKYNQMTSETIDTYDEKGVQTLSTSKSWIQGVINIDSKTTYKDGIITKIDYSNETDELSANITCNNTICTLNTFTGPFYSVSYNATTLDYDLRVDGETTTSKVLFSQISASNYMSVFNEIETKAQLIKDAQ